MEDNLVQEARTWAGLDGCEGGDLLHALTDTYQMSHYSSNEEQVRTTLATLIRAEIDAMKAMALGNDPEYYGFEPDQVARALKELETQGRRRDGAISHPSPESA